MKTQVLSRYVCKTIVNHIGFAYIGYQMQWFTMILHTLDTKCCDLHWFCIHWMWNAVIYNGFAYISAQNLCFHRVICLFWPIHAQNLCFHWVICLFWVFGNPAKFESANHPNRISNPQIELRLRRFADLNVAGLPKTKKIQKTKWKHMFWARMFQKRKITRRKHMFWADMYAKPL